MLRLGSECSERPEEKLWEEGCPESGEQVPFAGFPLGILGCFSSDLPSASVCSTSSTDSNTCVLLLESLCSRRFWRPELQLWEDSLLMVESRCSIR